MSRRDNLPPCPRCAGTKGAHTMVCPVPAIRRTAQALGSAVKAGDDVLVEAMRSMDADALRKIRRALDAVGG